MFRAVAHRIAQAMAALHQHRLWRLFQFKSRLDGDALLLVEFAGEAVGNVEYEPTPVPSPREGSWNFHEGGFLLNVSNRLAREFYEQQGVAVEPAFELKEPPQAKLMQCRHCLRYTMGYCTKHGGQKTAWREPLSLRLADGRAFRLEFDCKNCQMNILSRS